MRTFVINLDSSKLRMAEMSDQLSALLSNIEKFNSPGILSNSVILRKRR